MALTFRNISSLFLLVLFASQILVADSRESHFFSKTPGSINKEVILTDEDDNMKEPSFLPQNDDAYGLSSAEAKIPESYGSGEEQDALNESPEEQTNNYYNVEKDTDGRYPLAMEAQGMRAGGCGAGNRIPAQMEGMEGETRFTDNGDVAGLGNFNGQQLKNAENFNWP